MLVLSRKKNEDILVGVGADQIVIKIVEIRPGCVRIGIEAPKHVPVHRREVAEQIADAVALVAEGLATREESEGRK